MFSRTENFYATKIRRYHVACNYFHFISLGIRERGDVQKISHDAR